jgi:glutamate synthase domain-containing protein 2
MATEPEKNPAAPAESAAPPKAGRRAPRRRMMQTIEQMAATGESATAAMETGLPLPDWDDILLLGAQLGTFPLPPSADVSTAAVIGRKARKPLTLMHPFFVSHLSSRVLPAELKTAMAAGAAAADIAIGSGDGPVSSDVQNAAGQFIYEVTPDSEVSDTFLQSCDAVEIKIGQATKPGTAVFPELHDRNDVKKLVSALRDRADGRPIGLKIAAGNIEKDIFVCLFAEPDFITIDGRGGADGKSPLLAREAFGVPTVYAIGRAVKRLKTYRNENVALIVTGGLRTSADIVKALAMGADAVALGSAPLIAAAPDYYRFLQGQNTPACGHAPKNPAIPADAAARLARFLRLTGDEIAAFCRMMGHADIRALSTADLATVSRDIADHTEIPHA